jgi:sensor c-di-GMP phosphodiesterase-like protein
MELRPVWKWIRAHLSMLFITFLGALIGALAGFLLARAMLLRTAKATLSVYGQELLRNADDMADEINAIFSQYPRTGVACSNQDLAVMQTLTFRTRDVKDVGRTHEGRLYCSAFLGRLAHPYEEGKPTLDLGGGINIYTNVAVVLAAAGQGHGTVLEAGDVDIVLNSDSFGHWDRPHLNFMVDAISRNSGRVALIAGSPLAVGRAILVSGKSQTVLGTIYNSVCSGKHPVCIVTSESVADVWSTTRTTQVACTATGGFAGLSLGLFIALFLRRTRSLSHQLLSAVRNNSPSLSVLYQPILDVRSGQCLGAEALLRWTDQTGASIPPDLFISMAEETGFINEITAFVIARATSDLGDLLRSCEDFTLSINIAASDMGDQRLFQLLRLNVSLAGIRPGQIALELTERSTADLTLVRAAIQSLRVQGYKVHIDDFGIGFSSLSYIDQLNVNAIKIDRAFSRTIGTDAVIAPILSQMLEMANSLGVEVVVEGVETEIQRDYLADKGMTLRGQGWYFSKPLSADALHLFNAETRTTQYLSVIQQGNSTRLRLIMGSEPRFLLSKKFLRDEPPTPVDHSPAEYTKTT